MRHVVQRKPRMDNTPKYWAQRRSVLDLSGCFMVFLPPKHSGGVSLPDGPFLNPSRGPHVAIGPRATDVP